MRGTLHKVLAQFTLFEPSFVQPLARFPKAESSPAVLLPLASTTLMGHSILASTGRSDNHVAKQY